MEPLNWQTMIDLISMFMVFAFPISFILTLCEKLANMCLSMMFGAKIKL